MNERERKIQYEKYRSVSLTNIDTKILNNITRRIQHLSKEEYSVITWNLVWEFMDCSIIHYTKIKGEKLHDFINSC